MTTLHEQFETMDSFFMMNAKYVRIFENSFFNDEKNLKCLIKDIFN